MLSKNIKCTHRSCPVFLTLELLANKWSIQLLAEFLQTPDQTIRFNALLRAMEGITQGQLTKNLRRFEESGLLTRTIYPEIPPRVEYQLTSLGASLSIPINALSAWAEKHGAEVQQKRTDFAEIRV